MLCTSQLGYNLRHGLADIFCGKCSGNYFPCVNYILNVDIQVPAPAPATVHLAARMLQIPHWISFIIWNEGDKLFGYQAKLVKYLIEGAETTEN